MSALKDRRLFGILPSLVHLKLAQRLELLLPVSFLKALEKDPHLPQALDNQSPRMSLIQKWSREQSSLCSDIDIAFMKQWKTLFFKKDNKIEILSMWAWSDTVRSCIENAFDQPLEWHQWDWNEGQEVWKVLESKTAKPVGSKIIQPKFLEDDLPVIQLAAPAPQAPGVIALGPAPGAPTQAPKTASPTPPPSHPLPPKTPTAPPPAAPPPLVTQPAAIRPGPMNDLFQEVRHSKNIDLFLVNLERYLNSFFSSGIVMLVQNKFIAGWSGFGMFKNLQKLESLQFEVKDQSMFRIVLESMQPYHGRLASVDAHQKFFQHFGHTLPEHMTLLPCLQHGEVVLVIGGTCKKTEAQALDLYAIFEHTKELGTIFTKLSSEVSAA